MLGYSVAQLPLFLNVNMYAHCANVSRFYCEQYLVIFPDCEPPNGHRLRPHQAVAAVRKRLEQGLVSRKLYLTVINYHYHYTHDEVMIHLRRIGEQENNKWMRFLSSELIMPIFIYFENKLRNKYVISSHYETRMRAILQEYVINICALHFCIENHEFNV